MDLFGKNLQETDDEKCVQQLVVRVTICVLCFLNISSNAGGLLSICR